ncbi:uncharacterized protein KIAA1958-like isoform X3 [Serinus canaria]|uniref:uncharacterized protein KIAA1958-like isoform X3 n=1 Tax=Serinus canaria TaxID=9135 RepID=UPI0011AE3A42|nr:uncharacterized protein KIAA1958-like isoform X3 [Serinus canaria]
MSESTSDRGCSSTSSLQGDLSNLVIWAHTHGTICNQIPGLEFMQNTDHVSNDNAVLWMCRAGHAYHWHCGKSHNPGEDVTEAVGGRKRVLSSEPLARESSFEEKKVKLTPSSFEMDQEDCGSTGSCGRSQGVTEQKADSPYKRNNEPKGSQNTRKPKTSFSAAEQHFSMSDSRVQTDEQDVKSKSYKEVEIIISDEEQSEADEDNKGDRISQDNVSEPSAEKLQMHHCQKMALHQPTASQKTAFAPKAKPPLARAYIMQAPVSSSEDRSRNILRLASSTAAGPMAETSGTRSLLGSAAPKSPESHPPAASNGDVLKNQEKKKIYTSGDIKAFEEWLKGHHPSETRRIHTLPPADLDYYLVSFFSSAKKQNGKDFSASSLTTLRCNINRYLLDHNYQYSILRGPEFKASQEAYKLKHWYLFQKKEEGWNVVENLTGEDVKNLLEKGILSKTDPQGLLHLIFTNLIRGFGASTHHEAHHLYWGQVVLRKTRGEVEYLEWRDDLSPEENEGELNPQLFATPEDPENCPVASYKEYARRRPADMLDDNHPLYLSPRALSSVWDKVWYSKKALSKAKIDNILKVITQEVRGAVRKTKK